MAWNKGGGYYLDVGASQMIIDGKIKLKNGYTLDVDVVVFATGYTDARHAYHALLPESLHDKLYPIWGLDKEGELNSVWREVGGHSKNTELNGICNRIGSSPLEHHPNAAMFPMPTYPLQDLLIFFPPPTLSSSPSSASFGQTRFERELDLLNAFSDIWSRVRPNS
ncbi:uncharacterized protein F5891DRAFT_1187317 [Suillus fuscotomentosus]|uniref:Flavin-containing monooxygenase n=1 Tax=Suillus fuscotomentosus TaxID=1912939 RepID=A0AAD4E8T7_9AGAM|nr:uncharacterized protein F5891DRAFT_1187317 [Suillus fuscotomentosus]KAG1901838.1 hypothetical protein F5891DRAFT_1187317 [Suillus fuscotomentosus]